MRETGGGFPGVRALGLDLPAAGHAQVSMNVEDWEAARLHEIVTRIEAEAVFRGAEVLGSELVGLMPAGAAAQAAGARCDSSRSTSPGCSSCGSSTAEPSAAEARLDSLAMSRRTAVALTGDDLVAEHVWDVAVDGAAVALSEVALERVRAARALVEQAAHGSREHTYGINTGFGRFVSQTIPEELTDELQLRLLRSHACGVGEPYPREVVRAAMLLRANALAKGCSVRASRPSSSSSNASTAECSPTSLRAAPSVRAATSRPSRTSRCRSSARAVHGSRRAPGRRHSARAGGAGADQAGREGRALAHQRNAVHGGNRRARRRAGAAARRRLPTSRAPCPSRRCRARGRASSRRSTRCAGLKGQVDSAANILRLLEDSAIIEAHRWCDKVQDAYSLRCAPQVHGAARDLLDYVDATVGAELNAATDNPLVLVDDGMLVSNGNFHGQPLAFALDALAMAVAELASIAERRVERLVNPNLSDGLPRSSRTRAGSTRGS